MSCPRCEILEAKIADLEGRLEEMSQSGLGEKIRDLLATKLMEALNNDPSANMMSVARQFLKDNGYSDMRAEAGSPTNHLAQNYPFSGNDDSEQFGVQEDVG